MNYTTYSKCFHALTKNTIELQKMTPTTPIVSMQQYKTQMIKNKEQKLYLQNQNARIEHQCHVIYAWS